MTVLSYFGIPLQVCRMLPGCERTPIWDGPTYLYTRWRINARCLYNPQATSFDFPGVADQPGGGPIAVPNIPAQTDQAIRHRLMSPRRQLILGVGKVAWLVSPQQGFAVDSANGPTPLYCNVVKGPGGRSFVIDYGIETKLRECNLEKSNYPSIFLSHRWEMEHRMDDDFFTTRVIRGHVIFDTARVFQGQVFPDQFRGALFHPIPNNCQRRIPFVKQHADGNSVEYVIEDEEQQVNLGTSGMLENVTDIEASHEASTGFPGKISSLPARLRAVVAPISAAATGAITGRFLGLRTKHRLASMIGGAIGGAATGGLAGFEQLVGTMPLITHTFTARIHGNGQATKRQLWRTGYFIIASRLNSLNSVNVIGETGGVLHFAGWESDCIFDLKQRVVEVSAKIVTAVASLAVETFGVGLPNGRTFVAPALPQIPFRGDVPVVNGVNGQIVATGRTLLAPGAGAMQNARPPADGVSRGTFLEALTFQGLLDPCEPQTAPYLTDAVAVAPTQLLQPQEGVGLPAPFFLNPTDQDSALPFPGT